MFDTGTFVGALGGLKTILDLARNAKDAELAMKISSEIANIQGKLIEVQQHTLSLQEENQKLRHDLRTLADAKEEEHSFRYEHGVFWKISDVLTERLDEEGERVKEWLWDGPFCPLCKDVDGKAVRLRDEGQRSAHQREWWCEIHRTDYSAPTMRS